MNNVKMEVTSKNKCSGCGTCALVCPVKAIRMKKDEKGFAYPIINLEKCIQCGKCKKRCPALFARDEYDDKPTVYVGRHKNRQIIKNSMSGGAFTLFSDEIIKKQGIVYGVVMDDTKNKVYYTRATSLNDRDRMRGSKYVEAELNSTYEFVKKDILRNRTVLFVGTPCHVAGLKSYLSGIDCSNLYTIDILCSNVCSSMFFAKYIKSLEWIYGKTISKFKFRDQTRSGWRIQEESFFVGGKKKYMHLYRDLYYSRIFSRPSCDNCRYKSIFREGDISIGDAWGDRTRDNLGKSIILCNTEKGKELFNIVEMNGVFSEINVGDYLQAGITPSKYVIENREKAWKDLNRFGLVYTLIVNFGIKKIVVGLKEIKF